MKWEGSRPGNRWGTFGAWKINARSVDTPSAELQGAAQTVRIDPGQGVGFEGVILSFNEGFEAREYGGYIVEFRMCVSTIHVDPKHMPPDADITRFTAGVTILFPDVKVDIKESDSNGDQETKPIESDQDAETHSL